MKRTAKAHWEGTLKEGQGNLTTASETLNQTNYSFKTRFEDGNNGTNPEELLAAAHAGCFTMAVSLALTEKGYNPTSLDTEATVSMDDKGMTGVHLSITGNVPNMENTDFESITASAAENCFVSKALNLPISSEARLV